MGQSTVEAVGDHLAPFRIAAIYAVVSGAWIALSDRALALLVADRALYAQLQTAKGWGFVALSAMLLFALVRSRERRLERAAERTEDALRQAGVLHRVLRHNLRNGCNVIRGSTERLVRADGGSEAETECVAAVREQTERLVSLSEKTTVLQGVLRGPPATTDQDVGALLQVVVDRFRERHPSVAVDLEVDTPAVVRADEHLEAAIEEVLDNAVRHHDGEDPNLWVSVDRVPSGRVRVDVADDGPGVPRIEREVLSEGVERPVFHSAGLGLWLVRTIVVNSGGELRIVDNEPRGSVVRITLEAASERSYLP